MMLRAEAFEFATSGPWRTAGMDTQYKIERLGSRAYLAFQCSVSVVDWIANLAVLPAVYRDSPAPWMIHGGFRRVWKACRDEIMAQVDDARTLLAVGYSHGAVLASLALEDWSFHGRGSQAHATVFGCPRFAFALPDSVRRRFSNLVRYSVRGDIVTHLPPPIGYHHVGHGVRVGPSDLIPTPAKHQIDNYRRYL